MSLTEAQILAFYNNCEYWPAIGNPFRPRELHIPKFISEQDNELIEEACQSVASGVVTINLNLDDCREIAPVLLHESLFHFYKAFYNYLAARTLYFGGMLHWINVTLYYARFYLARSVTVLFGRQSYQVTRTVRGDDEQPNPIFISKIAEALANSNGRQLNKYRLCINIDIERQEGQIVFDKNRVSSHEDVWNDYEAILGEIQEDSGLRLFPFDGSYLKQSRNEENYSFEGYMQLDFNLYPSGFESYFERDYIKRKANTIFDDLSGDIFVALSLQLNLYRKLQVDKLPIEKEKFSYMIDYCLPDSKAKEHLLQLCNENFPTQDLYSEDGSIFCDEQGRFL
jgi:hypothetical protein